MKIYYPKRSKFLTPCVNAISQNKKSLLAGTPMSVKFSPQGYNGEVQVKIEKTNSTSFWTNWEGSDPTRFPVRIKAAAYALFKMGLYGDFIITHETGILTLEHITIPNQIQNNEEEKTIKPQNLQKKYKVRRRDADPLVLNKEMELKDERCIDSRVKLLLEFGKTINPQELFPVLVDGASSLIEENPFAFALATVLDRGTKAEIIWTIPYYLRKELGELNPEVFVGLRIEEIGEIFQKLPVKPRYINDAPRSVKELSEIVVSEFSGDASKIWKNKSSKEVKATFQRVHGVGPGISSMAVLLLERCFGIQFNDIDHSNMDVKPDIHVTRVFSRLGFISQLNEKEALKAARRLNPEYPGALDAPIWVIGRKWCIADTPQCLHCPVNEVCPKNTIPDNLKEGGRG